MQLYFEEQRRNQKEVSVKKNSYLTVFFEIGKRVILKSLAKCEKFSMKYQNENNAAYNSSNVTDVSSNSEDSGLLNDVSINTSANKTNSKQNQPKLADEHCKYCRQT